MRETLEELTQKFILNFGKSGPFALFVYSVYLLWNKGNLLYYYVCGIFLDAILEIRPQDLPYCVWCPCQFSPISLKRINLR